jgi:hypothetical protein
MEDAIIMTRPGSRQSKRTRKRKKMVKCPCCQGRKVLFVWHPDEDTPRKEVCIHCEGEGEIETDLMGQIMKGME